jgi:hypothetical protein
MMDGRRSSDDQPAHYQIRVRGAIDPRWSGWFAALTITHDAGDTLLAGPVADQAALYGLINRLRDLGVTLLAVAQLPTPVERLD